MAQSKHERVGEALELFNQAIRPYLERELKAVFREDLRRTSPGMSRVILFRPMKAVT